MVKISFFLWFILLLIFSCGLAKHKYQVYHNESFKIISELAKDKNLPFCIILSDSSGITSKEYIDRLKQYEKSINNTIYNFVNIDLEDNKWYTKILSPEIYPVTCIFNTSGMLIDLIPGNSKESFTYISKTINTMHPCLEFHYNQKYDKDKIEMIDYMNSAIALKLNVDSGQYVVNEIDSLFRVVKYPYLLYLKLRNQLQFKQIIEAKNTAKELLLFDSAHDLFQYYDEFIIANQLLDSTYNYKTAPLIESVPHKIELFECELNNTYNLDIEIVNKGKKTLKVSDILTSCSCVKLISPKRHFIYSGESLTLKIEFTPDISGNITREIYIASNSINTPVYIISINAMVGK